MKVLPWAVGFVLGVIIAQVFLPRFQVVTTIHGQTGFVLRVDRWTGRASYWAADSSQWMDVRE